MFFRVFVGHFCCCMCAFDFHSWGSFDSVVAFFHSVFASFSIYALEDFCCRSTFAFCSGGVASVFDYLECFCCRHSAFGLHPATPHWGGYSGPWIALCFGHRCCLLFLVPPVVYSFHSGEVSGLYVDFGASKLSVRPVNIWGKEAEPRVS